MKNIFKINITIFLILLGAISMKAQNVSDLIISEIMPYNQTNILDDYGNRVGWIELMNVSQGTVNYAGCFLSNDKNNLKKHKITEGDLRTKVGPRQRCIFYASGHDGDGIFYLNFKLERGKTIYLTSNDGRTIIDSLKIPENIPADKSICKVANDEKRIDFQVQPGFFEPTPMESNGESYPESKSEKMAREDPHGWILSLVSISVVFCALAILWFLFGLLGDAFKKENKDKKKSNKVSVATKGEVTPEIAAAISMALNQEVDGDEGDYTAIAMALHLYLNDSIHDQESFVITINNSQNSTWSDKSASFRKKPQK